MSIDERGEIFSKMITCDGVWVVVPGLLCDIENFRNHRPGPAGQLAKTHRKKRI